MERFTTVIFAPDQLIADVRELRKAAPPSGVPVMDAHVTVLGSFLSRDADLPTRLLAQVASESPPFPLTCRGLSVFVSGPVVSFVVPVARHADLLRLHDSMEAALSEACEMVGANRGCWYTPHLTLVQQIPIDQAQAALERLASGDYVWRFRADHVALMRQEADLRWTEVARAPLRGAM